MKVCVIGAGISGLSCIHELMSKGIEFDCFEKRTTLGGLWNYNDNDNSVYKNCKQNHPRPSMQINNTPIENSLADYLSHSEYLSYLQQFNSPNIHYGKAVDNAKYNDNKQCWEVIVDGNRHNYSHLIVCSGHYSVPKTPSLYNEFTGSIIHSKDYKTPEVFSGKRVLVVGGGSSGIQIASDLAGIASDVTLSVRTMPFILPRYIDNQVLLEFYKSVRHLPEERIIEVLKKNGIDQTSFNIPKPEQGLLSGSTIPICDDIFTYAKSNTIRFEKSANTINGNSVSFGNKDLSFDSVILATGYDLAFPFFDFNVDYNDNKDFLINQNHPNLFFIGMLQPVGPVPPLLNIQSKLVAKLIDETMNIDTTFNYWQGKSHRILLADYMAHLEKEYELA
jgi:thioredoxin reductase